MAFFAEATQDGSNLRCVVAVELRMQNGAAVGKRAQAVSCRAGVNEALASITVSQFAVMKHTKVLARLL